MLIRQIFKKLRPEMSEEDRKTIESIKALKTIRAVGGAIYVESEDVQEEMRELQKRTRRLVLR